MKNSVLGTFDVPVRGFHVGPLVLVALADAELKALAFDYFGASYNLALHPVAQTEGSVEGPPPIECKIDAISNSNVNVKSASCIGEGGPASYAYITGNTDFFVDGYSQGYDGADNGKLKEGDYAKILGSFKFTK